MQLCRYTVCLSKQCSFKVTLEYCNTVYVTYVMLITFYFLSFSLVLPRNAMLARYMLQLGVRLSIYHKPIFHKNSRTTNVTR